jgi:muramidase (phage lysozyme)
MADSKLLQQIKEARSNPNVSAMLDVIGKAEGADYGTLFGGKQFNDFSAHPNVISSFKQTDGRTNRTSAAGKYQFLNKTWKGAANQLGLTDFSPESQDLAAIYLMKQRGALDDVKGGNFKDAIGKLGQEWASLPSSTYAQPTRSADFINNALAKATGKTVDIAASKPVQPSIAAALGVDVPVVPEAVQVAATPQAVPVDAPVEVQRQAFKPATIAQAMESPVNDGVTAAKSWNSIQQADELSTLLAKNKKDSRDALTLAFGGEVKNEQQYPKWLTDMVAQEVDLAGYA